MDKTLDTVVLVHRLIIALVLALFAVGVSVHRPNSAYEEAERDIQHLKQHNSTQQNIDIQVVPGGFSIPDSTQDSLVTLETQVKWADRIYRDLPSPFYLCMVERGQVFQALDKSFTGTSTPKFTQMPLRLSAILAGTFYTWPLLT